MRENFRRGIRKQLCVAPTGAGKTTIAALMIDGAVRKERRVWFVAHRKELILQCSRRLDGQGVDHGIVQADHPRRDPSKSVQVVSVHTVTRKGRLGRLPAPDLIFVDEAHRSLAESYVKVMDAYPEAAVVGLTATPWRLDGKPLGDRYDELVLVARPLELIEQGFLLAPRIFAPDPPDLTSVRKSRGDFNNAQLADRMNQATVTGDIVRHYQQLVAPSPNPTSVLFAVNVEHSRALVAKFREAGVAAEHLDAKTPPEERERILRDLASGELRVVCNCEILTEGWDLPSLGAVILARPTKSVALYLQMAGRGMRTHEGKESWLLLDHAGCVREHMPPQVDRDYSLTRPATVADEETGGPAAVVCAGCKAVYAAVLGVCPECGLERPRPMEVFGGGREVNSVDGELRERTVEELLEQSIAKFRKIPWSKRRAKLVELLEQAREQKRSESWAFGKFKREFGLWPPGKMRDQARERLERGNA